jgi:UTP-glucose-1-phosphate uridylyltransferase
MNISPTVCILTAGMGTRMGQYASVINKALLPLGQKAIISHIIDRFPATSKFVIALGHFDFQVRHYLEAAHPDNFFTYVQVDNYKEKNSGPGYSLLQCSTLLQEPFFFVACDTLWTNDIPLDSKDNWFGTSIVDEKFSGQYCNFKIDSHSNIISILDKIKVQGPQHQAFSGLGFIYDYSFFWESLSKSNELKGGEIQISNGIDSLVKNKIAKAYNLHWIDLGNLQLYEAEAAKYLDFDFSKTDEFLYILNNRIVKFFNKSEYATSRALRAQQNPNVFPEIVASSGQFYSYKYIEGETLYHYCDISIFKDYLAFLKTSLWNHVDIDLPTFQKCSEKFYKIKTLERLELYSKKYNIVDAPCIVNGQEIPSLENLLAKIPWKELLNSIPVCFHGDLHFDNTIYNKSLNTFKLIDWRQDFGGCIEAGDLYYDLAKLNGGLILNYDLIKKNLFSYEEKGNEIFIDFSHRYLGKTYQQILKKFIDENNYDIKKVNLLTSIIYLNMAPLHHGPFDKFLYALGKQLLFEALKQYDN